MLAASLFVYQFVFIGFGDAKCRQIKNHRVIGLSVFGLLCSIFDVSPFGVGLMSAVSAGVIHFLALIPFYKLGLLAAGDVKLAGALGICFGIDLIFPVWVLSHIFALIHAIWIKSIYCSLYTPLLSMGTHEKNRKIFPFGSAMSLSSILILGFYILGFI